MAGETTHDVFQSIVNAGLADNVSDCVVAFESYTVKRKLSNLEPHQHDAFATLSPIRVNDPEAWAKTDAANTLIEPVRKWAAYHRENNEPVSHSR